MDEFLNNVSTALVLPPDENTIFTYDVGLSSSSPATISLLLKLHTIQPYNRSSLMKTLSGIWSSQCHFPVFVSEHADGMFLVTFGYERDKDGNFSSAPALSAAGFGSTIQAGDSSMGTSPATGQLDFTVRGKDLASASGVKRPSFQPQQVVVGGFMRSQLKRARFGDWEVEFSLKATDLEQAGDGCDAEATSRILDCLGPSLEDPKIDFLAQPFTTQEVKKAIFDLSGDRAPGLDGLNAYFYQKNWATLGHDFVHAVLECLNNGANFSDIHTTLIALIPKK
uniref:Uncharacterized protein n=1 Tax=Cannabis sativa TaxID=3483 RepID=A0A803PUR1_CANSA